MRELSDSILSAPLSALQKLTDSLLGSDQEGSGGTMEQISELLQAVIQAGDDIQNDIVDMSIRLLGPESWTPSGFVRTTADLTARMADALRYMDPSSGGMAAWQELANKVEIYRLVKDVKSKVDIPDGHFDLHEYIGKCYDLGAFESLWAVEGLGHDYAHSFRPHTENTQGILTDPSLKDIPAKSLTMLHAGIGLSFAQDLLKDVTDSTSDSDVRRTLEIFVRLCEQNSRPGYEGAALESLGLFTRTWHRSLVKVSDEQLLKFNETAAAYFWRGLGRALFFLPVNFVPLYGSSANAIRMSRNEPPHELGRRNAMAGVAWAATVVNMEQPGIMEAFLRQHGDELLGQDAFANGVASSIVMRHDTTPHESFIKEFIEHKVDESNKHLVDLWDTHIRLSGEDAIRRIHPVLCAHNRLGEVFRYQSLSHLVESF